MADKKSVAEQVAELTEKQQQTVARVGIWGTVILCVTVIPLLVIMILGFISFVSDPLSMTRQAMMGFFVLCGIIGVLLVAYFVVIKVAFPYYSDKKARYILKNRKNKK